MSKDAELETTKLSGYRDKVSIGRVRKKTGMREEALDSNSLNFYCTFRVSNIVFCLVFVLWVFSLINAALCISKHQLIAEMSER